MKAKLLSVIFASVICPVSFAYCQNKDATAERESVTSDAVEDCRLAKIEMKKKCEQVRKSCQKSMDHGECRERMRQMMSEPEQADKE